MFVTSTENRFFQSGIRRNFNTCKSFTYILRPTMNSGLSPVFHCWFLITFNQIFIINLHFYLGKCFLWEMLGTFCQNENFWLTGRTRFLFEMRDFCRMWRTDRHPAILLTRKYALFAAAILPPLQNLTSSTMKYPLSHSINQRTINSNLLTPNLPSKFDFGVAGHSRGLQKEPY